jgi:adenine deaminase
MTVFIREGSVAKNLDALAPLVTPATAPRCGLVTDDRHPTDLLAEGHLDHLLRRAVALGIDSLTAIRMVSLVPAQYFGLHDLGAIAPGYRADAVCLESLEAFRPRLVLAEGRVVAREGQLVADLPPPVPAPVGTVCLGESWRRSLEITATAPTVKVIETVPGQILTRGLVLPVPLREGRAVADPDIDLVKLVVVERHRATGRVGVGFLRGLGMRAGALASTVAHDSHNVIAAGIGDDDIATAIAEVERLHGGLVVVRDGAVLACLALPVAGLMSTERHEQVAGRLQSVLTAARGLGCSDGDPFMTLSFLALPVIPELRLTDHGLVDVSRWQVVSLFGND